MSGSASIKESNTGPSVNGDGHGGLLAQLQSFRDSDAARDALLQRLILECRGLEEKLIEKEDDLQSEVESRRLLQANMRETKRDLQHLRQQTESNPFALALIDGDGVIFHQALLQAGADGGSEAAYLLHGAIKEHLHDIYDNSHSWSTIVYVAANFEGLSRKLTSIGMLKYASDLNTFARAFSCSQPMFNFIDVGMGKERADHKLKEMFRLFVNNMQCKHIIFGGCHDNGYLPNLEPYKRDEQVSRRISLLRSTPAERGFAELGFDMTKFDTVFRDDPLPDGRVPPLQRLPNSNMEFRPQANSFQSMAPPGFNVFSQQPPNKPPTTLPSSQQSAPYSLTQANDTHRQALATPQEPQVTSATPSPGPPTYASASTISSALESKTINIASTKSASPRKAIFLNAEQQRIDQPLPKPDEAAQRALSARIKTQKVCNNFHLLNHCSSGKSCDFSHLPSLSSGERVALRAKARERPCYKNSQCRDVDCLSGHHCPRGGECKSQWCNFFDEVHYIDTKIKLKEYEDGEVDIVR